MSDGPADSPRFERPPVVETLLGVQFQPIEGFTTAHFGWYWREYLGRDWTGIQEAPALPDQFERFDATPGWQVEPSLTVTSRPTPERVLFTHEDGTRVVQVQPTRLVHNWKALQDSNEYPHFPRRLAQFHGVLNGFRRFLTDAGLGEPRLNQWEVTYVNHIPRGGLWETPRDWHRILPALFPAWGGFGEVQVETLSGQWQMEITPRRGRLHVTAAPRRVPSTGGQPQEVLSVTLTSRGPVSGADAANLDQGFRWGHDAIVEGFVEISSEEALRSWGWQP